jgi:uncharacterized protein YcgI (DUF1989 family)
MVPNIMKTIFATTIPNNTGLVLELSKNQIIRIAAVSTVDLVLFNRNNLRERFDQARTKVYNMKIFISTGDKLVSKYTTPMMTIIEDNYREGTHDLQKGMCSGYWRKLAQKDGRYPSDVAIPDYGCWENLSQVLEPYGIAAEDIPSPLNLFQTMKIDGNTGLMEHTLIRPQAGTYVDLKAEMNVLVGVSACADLRIPGKKDVSLITYVGDA